MTDCSVRMTALRAGEAAGKSCRRAAVPSGWKPPWIVRHLRHEWNSCPSPKPSRKGVSAACGTYSPPQPGVKRSFSAAFGAVIHQVVHPSSFGAMALAVLIFPVALFALGDPFDRGCDSFVAGFGTFCLRNPFHIFAFTAGTEGGKGGSRFLASPQG